MDYIGKERVNMQTKSLLSQYLLMRRPAMVERIRIEGKRTLVREPMEQKIDGSVCSSQPLYLLVN